ncbi:MAG TPA: phasin family protein [Pseudomonas sp.]|jgi:poly(hydroxyalkanoate) granule-associated protein|nr:phasin family protein [Pseudomonas sp.]
MADKRKQSGWSEDVEKYSRQIWLAGLGAYAKVGEDGSKLFDALVREGERTEQMVRDEIESVKNGARSRVAEARDKALGKWNALEEAFDKRLNGAITRLGVPSRNDILALDDKIESLNRQLDRLSTLRLVSDEPADEAPAQAARASKPARSTASKPRTRKPKAAESQPQDETSEAASQ